MGRNRLLVGGIVLVALIVIAYFAFMYPPPSKEDTSGAIGVAKKYRSEQIADKDVMLQEQEAAAKQFDRAAPEDQVGMLERAPNVLAGAITRASADFQAKLYREVATTEDRVRMLERLDPNMQEAVVKSVGMTMDQFNKLTQLQKSDALLEKAPTATLAQVVKFAEAKDQCSLFGKSTADMKRIIVSSLDPAEKSALGVMGRGPDALFEAATLEQQTGMLEKNPNILASAITRASADFQAKLYREVATTEDRVRMLERLDPNMQEAVVKSVGMTMDQFNKLRQMQKSDALLAKAPTATLAQVVKFAEAKDQCSLFGKSTADMKRIIVSSLDPAEKGIIMVGRGPIGLYERSIQEMGRTSPQAQ